MIRVFDYLLFLTAGIFLVIALNVFRGEKLIEFVLLLGFSAFYILWGIFHHAFDKSLHIKVVLEYIILGFLAVFLIKLVLL